MTHAHLTRRTTAAVLAALATGVAAPSAGARPFDISPSGSFVPAGRTQTAAPPATSHAAGGDISDWGYVAIGSGAAALVLIGIGGTQAASRRRQRQRPVASPRIAG